MSRPDREPEPPDYSVRLTLDIRGRERAPVWPWVVVLVAMILGSPFLGRLMDRLL